MLENFKYGIIFHPKHLICKFKVLDAHYVTHYWIAIDNCIMYQMFSIYYSPFHTFFFFFIYLLCHLIAFDLYAHVVPNSFSIYSTTPWAWSGGNVLNAKRVECATLSLTDTYIYIYIYKSIIYKCKNEMK